MTTQSKLEAENEQLKVSVKALERRDREMRYAISRIGLLVNRAVEELPLSDSFSKPLMSFLLSERVDVLSEPPHKISYRAAQCLNNFGVTTLGELVSKSDADLLRVRNFGPKMLKEIKVKLADIRSGGGY
jgi:DNA-directed RNA polymerase subunit alpha